ncbi:MAG: DNA repair protein RecN, partial [Chloroflexi bacterium]
MLEELRIQNFAIIDELELTFDAGFNVITGETGAGKSIIIDAVELLLGGKTNTTFVRSGADRALIEGTFVLNDFTRAVITPILQREELLDDDEQNDYITLAREIRSKGRATARVNGVTVSNDVLREIGEVLIDIHGQSEHLSLLKARQHINLLDDYADLLEVRSGLAQVVETLNGVRDEIKALIEDEEALKRRAERLRHEVEEIDAAELKLDEEDELRAERKRLANSEQLATLTAQATILLHGDDEADEQVSAVDQLMEVSVLLGKLAQIDPELDDDRDLADSLSAQAEELALSMRRYNDSIEYNPERLNEIEERLEVIGGLKRRYGGTVEAVLDYAERSRKELDNIEHSEERLAALRVQEKKLLEHIGELGSRISTARAKAGKTLAQGIIAELNDLRMQHTRFEVKIEQREDPDGCYVGDKRLAFDATGIDRVEFMMSANPGEPLRPLVKVASGGETARIMLALKRVLSQADHTPTLIFDEIDQGIGGRIGAVVGEKLWALSDG